MLHPLQVTVYVPEELTVYSQNDDVTEKKVVAIGSRIRERDKKNAEYYVGDYQIQNECYSSKNIGETGDIY